MIAIIKSQKISATSSLISHQKIVEVSTGEHFFKGISFVLVELSKFTKSEEDLKSYEDHWLYFLSRWSVTKRPPKTLSELLILEAYHQVGESSLSEAEYQLYLDAKAIAEKEAYNLEIE